MLWYENEVQRLENEHGSLDYDPYMVFYGSSSIRLWETLNNDFGQFRPVNLGFGGSTLAACVWFFDRLVGLYHPKSIVVYAGDNDLGDGRHPEEVFIFFQQLITSTRQRFGDIPLAFISIKPSITRWNIIDSIRYTNQLIEAEIHRLGGNLHFIDIYHKMTDKAGYPRREFLDPDGLHINQKGYALWKESLLPFAMSTIALPPSSGQPNE